MAKKLFLLDGMALVYRAHFAFISRPILTSKGVNTSALYGFTQTLLDILNRQQPTHLAVAFDTQAPTQRHRDFPAYKATRQEMPEDLSQALPHVRRMIEAFRIPVLTCDGYEADDIIGTLVRRAEREGFQSYMVTPDKDFGQLMDEQHLPLQAQPHGQRGRNSRPAGDSIPLGRARAGPGRRHPRLDGRRLRQHPRRARHRRKNRHQAHSPVRQRRKPPRPRRRTDWPA